MESRWIEDGGARGYLCVNCLNQTHKQIIITRKFKYCPICKNKMINGDEDNV